MLNGILWVLRTNCAWDKLPLEAGWGSGTTAHRRLRDWSLGGYWPAVQAILEQDYLGRHQINWQRLATIIAECGSAALVLAPPGSPAVAESRSHLEPPRLSDVLWHQVAELIPPPPVRRPGGREPITARQALNGILWVLVTGHGWHKLPASYGSGSGRSCQRRWQQWQAQGAWIPICRLLNQALGLALPETARAPRARTLAPHHPRRPLLVL